MSLLIAMVTSMLLTILYSIQVFSNDEVFLRSFGYDGNGVKRQDGPCCVCVTVYVRMCWRSVDYVIWSAGC